MLSVYDHRPLTIKEPILYYLYYILNALNPSEIMFYDLKIQRVILCS